MDIFAYSESLFYSLRIRVILFFFFNQIPRSKTCNSV